MLYGQAAVLNDHFQQLVMEWAEGEGTTVVVHSSPIKRRSRAIEKVFRSYRFVSHARFLHAKTASFSSGCFLCTRIAFATFVFTVPCVSIHVCVGTLSV